MKRFFLPFVLFCALFISYAFTLNPTSPYSSHVDEAIKAAYVCPTSSQQLKTNLADVFSELFDEIEKVDIHHDQWRGYYYTVYGKKDHAPLVKAILVNKEMAERNYFPNRQQLGMTADELLVICYWENNDGVLNCQYNTTDSVCGRIISGEKVCSDFNLPIIIISLPIIIRL